MRPTAAEMAAALGLQPHPEGGFFLETYRSAGTVVTARGDRAAATGILFLVTSHSPSRLHRLTSDELWVFQGGLPLELVTLAPDGGVERHVLGVGGGPVAGQRAPAEPGWSPQALVPALSWQGARVAGVPHLPASRAWALVSCIVTPGFDYADFELADREALLAAYPAHGELVRAFT
jgi:predicted cupin superfamily sugar epimerase